MLVLSRHRDEKLIVCTEYYLREMIENLKNQIQKLSSGEFTKERVLELVNNRKMDAGDIKITIVDIRGDKVRIGVEAPGKVPVHRQEVYNAIVRNRDNLLDRTQDERTKGVPNGQNVS